MKRENAIKITLFGVLLTQTILGYVLNLEKYFTKFDTLQTTLFIILFFMFPVMITLLLDVGGLYKEDVIDSKGEGE